MVHRADCVLAAGRGGAVVNPERGVDSPRPVQDAVADEGKAEAAVTAAKGLALAERINDHKYVVKTLAQEASGTMRPVEYAAFVADLVNYLDYIGEPVRNERIKIGIGVLIYLGILLVFAYALKRAYWKDVH